MKITEKIKILGLVIISFTFGCLIDRSFLDFPYLQLESKINILDIFSLLVTVAIAFMIPFFINKLIEEKRGLKSFLIEELRELIKIINKIKTIISDAHTKGSFDLKNRDDIIYTFHEAELKVASIREQLDVVFDNKSECLCKTLTDLVLTYSGYVTGGELMTSSFVRVDERFYRENNTQHSKIETGLKKLIHEIYKF